MQMKRAKAGRQPPPPPSAELPKRCLQRGNDATRRHRLTKKSRFSPGKHIGAEGRGVKNDAFNKVNGARRRRCHWSTSRPRLSPPPDPSPKPKAEERHSAEEPAGGPAANPKTRTSKTAARPGTSGRGAEPPQAQQTTALGQATATTQPPEAQPTPWAERRRWPPGHRPPQTTEPRVWRRRQRAAAAAAAPRAPPESRPQRRGWPGPAAGHARAGRRWVAAPQAHDGGAV
ncbi:hypothetical protein PVAP13_9NG489814 [Panicum virgatum]|uniref:Uncharacterized protein n=1 Tax=Panicum virgatum TaxID=38727 RepID=A0A8T0MRK8_PANVG|nr:hypothetical protein PVAP13_9NG489814 [Panicum virgatum]